MGCLSAREVQAVADREAAAASRDHAARCEACRRRVETRQRDMALLASVAGTGGDVPSALEARLRQMVDGRDPAGATTMRAGAAPPVWWRARVAIALAGVAAAAMVTLGVLPRFDPSVALSAAEVLDRSLQTLANARGIERLEYELVAAGIGDGSYRVEHVIDYGRPARYRLSTVGPDGHVQSAVAQDPETGRLSQLVRVDGRNFIVTVEGSRPLPSAPQMLQAQLASVLAAMQAAADRNLTLVGGPDGDRYVVEVPPVMSRGGAAPLDLYHARVVIDGRDFRILEFDASGALFAQPYTVSFRLIRRELSDSAPPGAFTIEPGAGDVVLDGGLSPDAMGGLLSTALREVARLRGLR